MSVFTEVPTIISVKVSFTNNIVMKDYSAKLVKTLLIAGNPELETVFARSRGTHPKPLHITPLYTRTDKGIRAVYAGFVPKGTLRRPHPRSISPVILVGGKEYSFSVGVPVSLLPEFLNALVSADEVMFGKVIVGVHRLSYEIISIDLEKEAETVARSLRSGKYVKVEFRSPTLLKDWLSDNRKKIFVPVPEAVLATPLYMVLADSGKLKTNVFTRYLLLTRKVFSLPYTVLGTSKLVWYVYGRDVLPALIGYVKFFVNTEALSKAEKIEPGFTSVLSKALVLANVFGVGSGRAAGFGHALVSV